MAKIICGLFLLAVLWKIRPIEAQRSLQQYLQLAGAPYSGLLPVAYNPIVPNHLSNSNIPPKPTFSLPRQALPPAHPYSSLPAFPVISLPSLLAGLSQPAIEKPIPRIQAPAASNIDAKLLNNLAVALQLLIVSNILNSPPPEVISEKVIEVKPEVVQSIYSPPDYNPPQPQYYLSQEQVLPVASYAPQNYVEQNPVQNYQPTRRSLPVIQSPYEALTSSSPYVDPLAQYSPLNSRKDLQSPYAMLDKDVGLFSMNDLF